MIVLKVLLASFLISSALACLGTSALQRRSIVQQEPISSIAQPRVKPAQVRSGLGQVTLINPLKSDTSGSITDESQLTCMDFTRACRWRNIINEDSMDWWRANGTVDALLLQQATGTAQVPRGPFAIVATGRAQGTDNEAIVASDRIECQKGNAELRFKYWTSPAVQLHVCLKAVTRKIPDYDFCATVPPSGPGPAFITIPGPLNDPFEIFLRADNFVFSTAGAEGGYVLLDDIEYFGDVCNEEESAAKGVRSNRKWMSNRRQFDEILNEGRQLVSLKSHHDVCDAVACSWSDGQTCLNYLPTNQGWTRAAGSQLIDNDGSFIFAVGGHRSVIQTKSFDVMENMVISFSVYMTSADLRLSLIATGRNTSQSITLFNSSPQTVLFKWAEFSARLMKGSYDSLSIEAVGSNPNTFVGVDNIRLMKLNGMPIC